MNKDFFEVLSELTQLSEELNCLTAIEDCESTSAFFGTLVDYTLKGKWLCADLPSADAWKIAKDKIVVVMQYELDVEHKLLCVAIDDDARIIYPNEF